MEFVGSSLCFFPGMLGEELADYKKWIEIPYRYWDILLLAIITAVISNFW